ncbi:MAG: F0F1 ATP synthase subunit gamma [Thermoanaerobaculia bacterium]
MSDTTASLRRKIGSAGDLQSVVRTMNALAASSVGQYEASVRALADYYRTVELGLGACLREAEPAAWPAVEPGRSDENGIGAVVFGSDQGLVGRFNEEIAEFAVETLARLPGEPRVWAVGERVRARLADAGLPILGLFRVPTTVQAITPLVGQIQIEIEARRAQSGLERIYVLHNRPRSAALYEPVSQRLLPLDEEWRRAMTRVSWPTRNLPEVLSTGTVTLRALLREYFFISLFRGCAESLAAENTSRLAAMQRADKNIGDMLEGFQRTFHRVRQSGIDEELFDVVSGFEALSGGDR